MQFENKLILSFSKDSWESTFRCRQQVMSRLAKRNTVLYVTWNFTFLRVINVPSLLIESKEDFYNPIYQLYVFSPHQILSSLLILARDKELGRIKSIYIDRQGSFNQKMKKLVRLLISFLINKKIEKLDSHKEVILYIWHPDFDFVIGGFNERLVCYHIYDEYSLMMTNRNAIEEIKKREENILKKADIVFAVSEELVNSKKEINKNIHFTPNGVDFKYFDNIDSADSAKPIDIIKINRPIIGYIGRIKSILDLNLLLYLSEERRDWSIVLVGPIGIKISNKFYYKKLKKRKNIYFLGDKDIKEIPKYIKEFDVCLMPYRIDTHIIKGYPLKFNEYLAMGNCIVSSDLPFVKDLSPLVKIAKSYEEWITSIEYCLSNQDRAVIEQRKLFASKHDWDTIVQKIEDLICTELKIKEITTEKNH